MKSEASPGDPWIIAGLGNPGRKYSQSRHNVGFAALDRLASEAGIEVRKVRFKSLVGEGLIEGMKVVLLKPQTYMNLSGEGILDVVQWYKPSLSRLLLIYDDADLELGRIRIRKNGSAGTHNGMKSIIFQLASDDFPRIRVGIGKAPEGYDMADFVLSAFNREESKIMGEAIGKAADAAKHIILYGLDAAMNRFNPAKTAPEENLGRSGPDKHLNGNSEDKSEG